MGGAATLVMGWVYLRFRDAADPLFGDRVGKGLRGTVDVMYDVCINLLSASR